MAKALFGHVARNADPRLVEEIARLRDRLDLLETELRELRARYDFERDLRQLVPEPA